MSKINIFLNHNLHSFWWIWSVKLEPERRKTACQTLMWIRSQLGIFWTQPVLNFPYWQDHWLWNWHMQSKVWNSGANQQKMVWEQICFGWKELISFKEKNNRTSRQESRDYLVMSVVNNSSCLGCKTQHLLHRMEYNLRNLIPKFLLSLSSRAW